MKHSKTVLTLAVILALSLVAAACGDDAEEGPTGPA